MLAVVDTIGNPICTKILRGLTEELDLKALNIVTSLKFTPAYQRNKVITLLTTIPVRVKVDPIKDESYFYGEWQESNFIQAEDQNYVGKKFLIPDSTTNSGNKITFLQDSLYLYTINNNVIEGKYWVDVGNRKLYMSRLYQPGSDRFEVFYIEGKLILRSPSGKIKLLFPDND